MGSFRVERVVFLFVDTSKSTGEASHHQCCKQRACVVLVENITTADASATEPSRGCSAAVGSSPAARTRAPARGSPLAA